MSDVPPSEIQPSGRPQADPKGNVPPHPGNGSLPDSDSPLNAQILAASSVETAGVLAGLSGAHRAALDMAASQAAALVMLNAAQAQQRDAILSEVIVVRQIKVMSDLVDVVAALKSATATVQKSTASSVPGASS